MGMGFLNDDKLKKDEFDKAAKFVADRYDIDNVEIELGKLPYLNLQIKEPASHEELVDESATEKADVPYVSLTDIAKNLAMTLQAMLFKAGCEAATRLNF